MARGAALTGSLVVHAVLLAAIAGLGAHRETRPTSRRADVRTGSVAIELTAPIAARRPPTAVPAAANREPNGMSRPPDAASRPPTTAIRMPEAASRTPTTVSRGPMAASRMPTPTPTPMPTPASGSDPSATVETTLRIESGTGVSAAASDGGTSRDRGNGIGFGAGGGIASPVDTARLATPEPPPKSLARPPRLIWPVRQGEIGDGPSYVARITVDSDGFVAAARLVQGTAIPGAADAIWRFRYDPALDDDGRPVAAALDQPFLLR